MSTCEKCWKDSRLEENYAEVLKSRAANPCTPEQQAGEHARECPWCGRMTLHQHTGEPMCRCPRSPREHMAGHTVTSSVPESTK